MTDTTAVLQAALKAHGITSHAMFEERYGYALGSPLTGDDVLYLLGLPDHPRSRKRATWTPCQSERYIAGCLLALDKLKERLEHGLIVLNNSYSLPAERRWFRLATRSTRLIGKLSAASGDAGAVFCESELGRWYAALGWPVPSMAARLEEW